MAKSTPNFEKTKALMGALVRMKPKPHEDMKVGKKREPGKPSPRSTSRQKNNNRSKPK